MSMVMRRGAAVYAFANRQFILTKRYMFWEIVYVIYSLANVLAIGYMGEGIQGMTGPGVDTKRLILYLLTGSLLWGYLAVIFWEISNIISWERWEGTIEYTFMAPVSRATHIFGVCTYAVIYSLLRTIIMLAMVAVFFHLDLTRANLWGAFVVLTVANFSFIGLGTVVAVLPLISPEKGAQMTGIVEGVLLLVSGVYYDVSVLPGWMQSVSKLSPATYALQGMRSALLNGDSVAQLWSVILPLIVIGAVLVPLGLFVFGKAEVYCKKTGKLKRSG
ncbi:ABC transporter permease [bacterium]|nr:ABC transporter permease [bacterium]